MSSTEEADGVPNEAKKPTLKKQIATLSLTVNEHAETLASLKDIPKLIVAIHEKLNKPGPSPEVIDPGTNEGQEYSSDLDEDGGLEFESFINTIKATDSSIDSQDINSEVLRIINEAEKEVEYGPNLLQQVADGLTKAASNPCSKDTLESIRKRLKVPENCKKFGVSKVNSEIWSSLPIKARFNDVKSQQLQQSISNGLVAFAQITNLVASAKEIPSDLSQAILRSTMDGVKTLNAGFQDWNSKRRMDIKPYLNEDYSGICSSKVPVTENLFGNDLAEVLKATKATSALVRRSVVRQFKGKPYSRPSSSILRQDPLNYQRPPSNFMRRGGMNRGRGSNFTPQNRNRPQRQYSNAPPFQRLPQ